MSIYIEMKEWSLGEQTCLFGRLSQDALTEHTAGPSVMYSPCPTRGQKEPHTPAHTLPTQRQPGQKASARTQAQRAGSWAWGCQEVVYVCGGVLCRALQNQTVASRVIWG